MLRIDNPVHRIDIWSYRIDTEKITGKCQKPMKTPYNRILYELPINHLGTIMNYFFV